MTRGKLVSFGYNLEEISYLPPHLEVTYVYVEQNGNLTSVAPFELGRNSIRETKYLILYYEPRRVYYYTTDCAKTVHVAHVYKV
jgi:hypothetical protein